MPSFEATFRNLYLNQRVDAKSPLIPKAEWMACKDDNMEFETGEVRLGIMTQIDHTVIRLANNFPVKPGPDSIARRLAATLAAMKADGTTDALYQKHLERLREE